MLVRAGIPTFRRSYARQGVALRGNVKRGAAKMLMRLGHELSGQMGPVEVAQPLLPRTS
jgi:hypothetical protein